MGLQPIPNGQVPLIGDASRGMLGMGCLRQCLKRRFELSFPYLTLTLNVAVFLADGLKLAYVRPCKRCRHEAPGEKACLLVMQGHFIIRVSLFAPACNGAREVAVVRVTRCPARREARRGLADLAGRRREAVLVQRHRGRNRIHLRRKATPSALIVSSLIRARAIL